MATFTSGDKVKKSPNKFVEVTVTEVYQVPISNFTWYEEDHNYNETQHIPTNADEAAVYLGKMAQDNGMDVVSMLQDLDVTYQDPVSWTVDINEIPPDQPCKGPVKAVAKKAPAKKAVAKKVAAKKF